LSDYATRVPRAVEALVLFSAIFLMTGFGAFVVHQFSVFKHPKSQKAATENLPNSVTSWATLAATGNHAGSSGYMYHNMLQSIPEKDLGHWEIGLSQTPSRRDVLSVFRKEDSEREGQYGPLPGKDSI
jgi:hypothetical protein